MFNKFSLKRKIFVLVFLFVSLFSFFPVNSAKAQNTDFPQLAFQTGKLVWEKFIDTMKKVGSTVASGLYRTTLSNAVNTLAYDTATWLGSGGRGQKPLFVTDFGQYAANIGDAAAGQFIESLGQDVFGVNVCSPSLGAKIKIGLGLVEQQRPGEPNCTLSEMYNNWDISKANPDFLRDLYGSIDPTGTDLGAALYAQNKVKEIEDDSINKASKYLETFQGWITPKDAGGKDLWMPNTIKDTNDLTWSIFGENLLKDSGNALVDAAKVFTNQLALTAFRTQLQKIGRNGTVGIGYTGNYGLADAEDSPYSSGASGAENIARKIIEPSFATRGDYDILASLSVCNRIKDLPDGTTDCVIDERFRQAIEQKKTLGEAVSSGLLNGSASFGFKVGASGNPEEPSYQDGFPYRSMIILRKYRIIPVGWELAAEYIKNHPQDPDVVNNATLEKMIDCYSDKDGYGDFYRSWCAGLVDPDWVLKAPQNYCGQEGYGPRIISKISVPQGQDSVEYDSNEDGVIDSNDKPRQITLPNKLTVSRLDDYCADEQSCIKENDDGSCKYYGYCEEEKREWRFEGESCEANFNTCETFNNSDGETMSFLKNTLSFCDEADFGCKNYVIPARGSYNSNTQNFDWTKISGNIFLNSKAESCDSDSDGCRALIRLNDGGGANIIPGGNFESDNIGDNSDLNGLVNNFWPTKGHAEITDNVAGDISASGKVLIADGSSGVGIYSFDHSFSGNLSVFPEGFVFEPENSYTLSADIYIQKGDKVVLSIGRDGGYREETEVFGSGWQSGVSVSINNNEEIAANQFAIYGYGSGDIIFYIDNIKLEVGNTYTGFSFYGQKGLINERLLPAWLEDVCYAEPSKEDYRIRSGAPAICNEYARKCSREEVGCQGFTPVNGGAEIPASITADDSCPQECNGYKAFIQEENIFNTKHPAYFIAATAESCSAAEVGCEEFTNLDQGASGGEAKEYYSYLRRCVKPDDAGSACADFYVWSGTGESGQQLTKVSLQKDGNDVALTEDDDGLCDSDIFNYSPKDTRYNPDCRQFYDQDGNITYHLYSRTISCTADCHPYRMSNRNILEGISSQAACVASGYPATSLHWDANNSICNYCASGGVWSDEHNSCIYNALPTESYSCSAASAGCGEYRGNTGNNFKSPLLFADFEDDNDDWNRGTLSREAISGKQSYFIPFTRNLGSIDYKIGTAVVKNQSYLLSFIAKAQKDDAEVMVYLKNSTANQEFSSKPLIVKPNIWGSYSIDLLSLDHTTTKNESLVISVNAPIFIDNIKFSLSGDRYYLVRDSWNTPQSCDSDNNGRPYPLYMLGCSAYRDRLGETKYLHSFNRLCQDSAIGCEAFIDTRNSSSPFFEEYNSGSDTYKVSADEVIYATYDTDKFCDSLDKGCELLGETSQYDGENSFSSVFVKNDPDKYDKTMCSSEGVGCDKWTTSVGDYYFKNPGDSICEWRQSVGSGVDGGWGWYKKKVKRCGGDGSICSSNSQCLNGQSCVLETSDNVCPTSQFKTFGQGGLGNEIYQPINDGVSSWAGVCDAKFSGCTEYIDPVSDFSEEILYNNEFDQDNDDDSLADGWVPVLSGGRQDFNLEGNNLYILTVESDNSNFRAGLNLAETNQFIYELSSDNTLPSFGSNSLEVRRGESKMFYLRRSVRFNDKDIFAVSDISVKNNNTKVSLKKAVINYQIADEIDRTSCNGQASLSGGCVYFNERSVNGSSGLSALNVSAFSKYDSNSYINSNNANALIKVRPDRDCGSWLACKSYVEEEDGSKTCFEVASCDRMDDQGNCINFSVKDEEDKISRTYGDGGKETAETIKNLSGYSKVGYEDYFNSSKNLPNNLYSFGDMKQIGYNISVSNGDFELYDEDNYNDQGSLAQRVSRPVGWNLAGHETWTNNGADSSFTVIADPDTANSLLIQYPMVGKSFLQYSLGDEARYPISEIIYVDPGVEYYLSYYLNTSDVNGDSAEIRIMDGATRVATSSHKNLDGWVFYSDKFKAPASGNVRIVLGGLNAVGKVYIDDIKISPVLVVSGDGVSENSYTGRTCRLYPEEDSLSCEYFNENGSIYRGEYGYCLEYDRYPGDPNACLLWWPIEKIQGSNFSVNNNTAGYSGREPLYYCIGANASESSVKTKIGTSLSYPNISNILYEVEESMDLIINGEKVISVDENYHSGRDYAFPLRYGTNTIEVWFQADQIGVGDHTELRIAGDINYLDYSSNATVKKFNIVDLFKEFIATPRGEHLDTKSLAADGSLYVEYDCGDKEHDEIISVKTCDVGQGYGSNEYITNSSGCGSSKLCNAVSGTSDSIKMIYSFYIPELVCSKIAQVVKPEGANKAWANRVKENANYSLSCNPEMPTDSRYGDYYVRKDEPKVCYSSDAYLSENNYSIPFGSIRIPSPDGEASESFKDDPFQWGLSTSQKPLPYVSNTNKTTFNPPYQTAGGHMGQLYDKNVLSSLFAQSYGVWDWDSRSNVYVSNDSAGENWSSPLSWCTGNARQVDDNCAVAPDLFNIKGNNSLNPTINRRGFVNLTFNSRVDIEQLPVTSYEINWGDGDKLVVSGIEESDRRDEGNPYSASHSYEYWDLKTKDNNSSLQSQMPTLNCPNNANYCTIKPLIRVRDNWGWCTEGRSGTGNSCPATGVCMNVNTRSTNGQSCVSNSGCPSGFSICSDGFYEFPGVITVYEK